MSNRQTVTSGAPWESENGYRRGVRIGNHIAIAGTLPLNNDGTCSAPDDAYAQTRRCFEIAVTALRELGGDLSDVLRTRMFVTDISRSKDYGRAHRDFFGDHPPAATMVEIKGLVVPDTLIEVEIDAVLAD